MSEEASTRIAPSRRTMLKFGAAGAAAVALGTARGLGPDLANRGLLNKDGVFHATSIALSGSLYIEKFPTSPLILSPFTDELPIPKALRPIPKEEYSNWAQPPGPGLGQQNSLGNETHQIWPSQIGYPDPIVYKLDVMVGQHSFTNSQELQIDVNGRPADSYDAAGNTYPVGTKRDLPPSTIYGFNGVFPGPMINNEYGKPALVRFENHLDENPLGLD